VRLHSSACRFSFSCLAAALLGWYLVLPVPLAQPNGRTKIPKPFAPGAEYRLAGDFSSRNECERVLPDARSQAQRHVDSNPRDRSKMRSLAETIIYGV